MIHDKIVSKQYKTIVRSIYEQHFCHVFENMEDREHNEASKLELAKTLSIMGQNPYTDMQVLPCELTVPSGSKYEWIGLKDGHLA